MATILLGVTGSIAAYKAADLASKLSQAGHAVTVLMTQAACQLVQPSTFLNLTGNKVFTDLWDPDGQTQHIALTDAAELVVLAPATANSIAKLAHGLADDMVSTTLLAIDCPLLIAPAMNTRMWSNPVVQENLAKVKQRGHTVLEPDSGNLACGHVGAGRMAEPAAIAAAVEEALESSGAAAQADAAPSIDSDIVAALASLTETAGVKGNGGIFFELVSYQKPPGSVAQEAERRFRRELLAAGALLASGALGPTRFGHVHRAESLEEALKLARQSPMAKGKCSIHVFPWAFIKA